MPYTSTTLEQPVPSTVITAVTGSTRCGSTLLMRMLAAGGMPVFAENTVSMETPLNLQLPHNTAWLFDCQGQAVKLLEPLYFTPPAGHAYRFILLVRDYGEQAKSQRKFFMACRGGEIPMSAIPKIAKSLRTDIPKMRTLLRGLGCVYEVRFEALLRHPKAEAEGVAEYLKDVCPLDVEAMAEVVLPRPPHCLPGLLELAAMPGHTR